MGTFPESYRLHVSRADAVVREMADGSLEGPNGIVYRRTASRLKRRTSSQLVAEGAPVVTRIYPEGLAWHGGGSDATDVWLTIKPRLVEGRRPALRDLQWIGHLWESDEGAPLLMFEGQH